MAAAFLGGTALSVCAGPPGAQTASITGITPGSSNGPASVAAATSGNVFVVQA